MNVGQSILTILLRVEGGKNVSLSSMRKKSDLLLLNGAVKKSGSGCMMCSGRRKGVDSQFMGISLLSGMSLTLNGTLIFNTSA